MPGMLTTAYLTMQLCLGKDMPVVVMPFDKILPAVAEGRVDAGLLIHEGQLYYGERGLHKVVDLGEWWYEQTGSPCRWAATWSARTWARRWSRGSPGSSRRASATPSSHREEALEYALRYARDLDPALADRFVGMYVNDWTIDYGPEGPRGGPHTACTRGGSGFSPGAA